MDDEELCNKNLPDELIEQILSLLPVKTLIRFRSVCKSWYSFIANSSFIKLHLANHSSSDDNDGDSHYILAIPRPTYFNSLYCSLTCGKTCDMQHSRMVLPLLGVRTDCIIKGSCNGLICLYCSHGEFGDHMYIWNPCIRRFKPIPPPSAKRSDGFLSGIGFHEPTNDYIVVKLTDYYYYQNSTKHQVNVYSLNADSWRTVTRSNRFLPNSHRPSVSLNGYIYWIGKNCVGKRNMIISFSISGDDLFERLMLPCHKKYAKNRCPIDIQVVKESLYLLIGPYISFGKEKYVCDVWVMKEHGVFESWTKLYSVVMKEGIVKHCGLLRLTEGFIYGITVNGDILLAADENEMWPNRDLFVYDHKSFKLVNLQTQGFHSAISFMGSLVLLDCPGTKSELWITDDRYQRYRWDC